MNEYKIGLKIRKVCQLLDIKTHIQGCMKGEWTGKVRQWELSPSYFPVCKKKAENVTLYFLHLSSFTSSGSTRTNRGEGG